MLSEYYVLNKETYQSFQADRADSKVWETIKEHICFRDCEAQCWGCIRDYFNELW